MVQRKGMLEELWGDRIEVTSAFTSHENFFGLKIYHRTTKRVKFNRIIIFTNKTKNIDKIVMIEGVIKRFLRCKVRNILEYGRMECPISVTHIKDTSPTKINEENVLLSKTNLRIPMLTWTWHVTTASMYQPSWLISLKVMVLNIYRREVGSGFAELVFLGHKKC